ncbi:hypothetical protein HRbin07_00534 [bacterium HR07]|uniref:Antitoxin n=1 Tax=Acetithermum autotrophicum TaxID=1446466 RepID=H5SQY1_ACEAU|nr:hypothetical protein HGMM_OP2C048 [Candidatus Acetothermum autotrophicum]GBC76335.1 hypothetical protein HRbin07_00534 [bacterium HR07]
MPKQASQITRIAVDQARFDEIIRRVTEGREYIVIERDGTPVLGILDADELEDYLDLHDQALQEQIRQGYQEYQSGRVRPVERVLAQARRLAKR